MLSDRKIKSIPSNILYTTCCEDPDIIKKSLKINDDDVILSITSSGCNILNLLLNNPKKIISIDANPYQNYLLRLKIKAIQCLDYTDFIELLGVVPSNRRLEIYNLVRNELDNDTRIFWDLQTHLIEKGIIYDKMFFSKWFRKIMLFIKSKKTIEKFFQCKTLEEQKHYFLTYINGFPWRFFNRFLTSNSLHIIFLSINDLLDIILRRKNIVTRNIISSKTKREGYQVFFRYMQKLYHKKNQLKKEEHILTNQPIKYNFFASLKLLGYFINNECVPPYLKKPFYNELKKNVEKIQVENATLYEFLKKQTNDSISKFYLSNIFDWMDYEEFIMHLYEIHRVGKNQARLCYFSTRVDRDIPTDIDQIRPEKELANLLLLEDRTLFYGTFNIGKISK